MAFIRTSLAQELEQWSTSNVQCVDRNKVFEYLVLQFERSINGCGKTKLQAEFLPNP